MACIHIPQCNFLNRYFRCLLPEGTIDVEENVKTMKGIHMFRRKCITQIISCKSWSPRQCPYPSLVRKMQTYLELKDQDASQPLSSSNQAVKHTISSLQKALVPRKAIDKKQKKRSKMPIRKQLKVRLIEKPTMTPETIATTATATQTLMMKPTATSTKWSTAKLTPIPLTVYNAPNTKIQEVPSPLTQKPKGREVLLIPNLNSSLIEQQPTYLQPKASATVTSAIPLTRDDTPWSNSVPASTNLFVARS